MPFLTLYLLYGPEVSECKFTLIVEVRADLIWLFAHSFTPLVSFTGETGQNLILALFASLSNTHQGLRL
jgi:hypothetical protein